MRKRKSLQRISSSGKDLFLTLSQALFQETQNHQDINLLNRKYLMKWKYKLNPINALNFLLVQLLLVQLKKIFDQNSNLMELLQISISKKMREARLLSLLFLMFKKLKLPYSNAMVVTYLVKISRSTFLNQSLKRMVIILYKGIRKLVSNVTNKVTSLVNVQMLMKILEKRIQEFVSNATNKDTLLVNAQMLIQIMIVDLQEEKTIICQETNLMSMIPKNLSAKTSSTILFLEKLNSYLQRGEAERTISVEMK